MIIFDPSQRVEIGNPFIQVVMPRYEKVGRESSTDANRDC